MKDKKKASEFVRFGVLHIIFLCCRSWFGIKLEIVASKQFKTVRFLGCDEGTLEISTEKASELVNFYLKQAGYPKSRQLHGKNQVAQAA